MLFSGTFLLALNELDYGYVTEGTESNSSFWIFNEGVADLVVDSMMNQTEYFTLTPTSGIVPPGDLTEVSVTFSPETVGAISIRLWSIQMIHTTLSDICF